MGDLSPSRHAMLPMMKPQHDPRDPNAVRGLPPGCVTPSARSRPEGGAADTSTVKPSPVPDTRSTRIAVPSDLPQGSDLARDPVRSTHVAPGKITARLTGRDVFDAIIPSSLAVQRRSHTRRMAARLRRLIPGFPALSFALIVVAPLAVAVWYLFVIALPQFHSDTAFSVRSENAPAISAGILGAISGIGGTGGSDADILFDYIRSQPMVEAVDRRLNLRRLWAGAPGDTLFALAPDATVEDLVDHWNRMVDVRVDDGSGLISVQARAFSGPDAQAISKAIVDESRILVNRLSQEARDDAIRMSAADLADAEAALRVLRARMADFRIRHRMIDPQADVAGTAGVVGSLEGELAEAIVARDTLSTYADETDHRMVKATRRINAIQARIDAEKSKVAAGPADGGSAEVVGEFEALATDLEFAQAAYTQALANAALARAEARRQARYLAAHVEPTRAETPLFPRSGPLSVVIAAALMTAWMIVLVIRYNVRDSR